MQSNVLSLGKLGLRGRRPGHRQSVWLAGRLAQLRIIQAAILLGLSLTGQVASLAADLGKAKVELSSEAIASIEALQQEKATRSPVHRKLDSQLVYALRETGAGRVNSIHPHHRSRMRPLERGQVLLDIRANVTPELLAFVQAQGGTVVHSAASLRALRVRLSLSALERLAARPEVRRVRPADEATTNAGSVESEGGVTHGATSFREKYRVDGSGVKVGVLSDSVDFLSNVRQSGDLPEVTIIPGQEGLGSGEGTAMLEIVHDLAPGAELYFATAFRGEASFAQNIRALHAAGCRIIIDDITYFNESPFQDGIISQAVRDVCDAGTLYFSSAGNSGNKGDASAGTWEGDFVDGGTATLGRGGRLHSFGANTFNTVLAGGGFRRIDLFWSDPLGQSTNDYDVYVLDSAGRVVASSTNIQDGNDDPYENINSLNIGDRIVIVKQRGEARYLHLSTGRARLAISTGGNVRGHNAASATNAFSVAASWVGAVPKLYTASTVNQVEVFSSDGPRRMFYDATGNPFTPGNLSSTGGRVLQKPDITAADGVATATPDFRPFFGTSAAAPHAGAIAALIWSYNPTLTPAEVREAMLTTALDIEAPGVDPSSGYGIVMPESAVASVRQPAPRITLQSVVLRDENGNGHMDANECGELTFELRHLLAPTGSMATGLRASLTSQDVEVVIDPAPQVFPDLSPQSLGSNSIPFRISTKDFPSCDRPLHFELHVSADNIPLQTFPFQLETQSPGDSPAVVRSATDVPKPIVDLGETVSVLAVDGLPSPIATVEVELHLLHTYLSDLVLELMGPDGTTILLAANQGGNGSDYGASCVQRTRLSDAADSRLGSSTPPYVGTFRSEESLGAFRGKSGDQANGNWRLKLHDIAENDVGVLVCWSLDFRLVNCELGNGRCLVPPEITQQPADQLRVEGQPAAFSLVVTGTAPLSYEWFKDGQAIPGAVGAELLLDSVSPNDAGSYSVRVSNPYGFVESLAASLQVATLPEITSHPTDRTVSAGDPASFFVAAQGTGPLTYQWFFGVTPLTGQTNDTLVLASVSGADAGTYLAQVSSPYGEATSSNAVLTVILPPSISRMPSDLVVTNGGIAVMTVEVAGTPPLTFYWVKDETQWISDAVDSSLLLSGVTLADAGFYSLVVSNQAGVVRSRSAQLDVLLPVEFLVSPTNQVIALHGSAELVSLALGVPAPAYQWYRSTPEGFEIIDGATNANLQLPAVDFSDTRGYQVTASNLLSMATSLVAQIQVLAVPLVTSQPSSLKVVAGTSVFFEVAVSGEGPFTYQWFVNADSPLLGKTEPRLILSEVSDQDVGSYHVVISNLVGSVASHPARLELGSPVVITRQPVSLEVGVGGAAVFQVAATGDSPLAYQWYFNATNVLAGQTNETLELSGLTFDSAGDYGVVVENFAGSVTSQLARLDVLQPPLIVTDPTSQSVILGATLELSGAAEGSGPLVYRWIFNDNQVVIGAEEATLRILEIGAEAEGSYALEVSNRVGIARSAAAVVQVIRPPRIDEIAGARVVAFGGHLELRAMVTGTPPFQFQWLREGAGLVGQTNETLILDDVQFSDAQGYQVQVTNPAGSALSDVLSVSVLEAPVITVPPRPQLLAVGRPLVLTAVVTGSEPLSFQWIYNTNHVLEGENRTVLEIPSVELSPAGTYQLLVSNAVGTAFSGHVRVRVAEPPALLTQPEDISLPRGRLARLAVEASGSTPLRYQWYFEAGSPVVDATNATLTIPNVSSADEGGYRVVVTNDVGSVTSRVALIDVKEVPLLLSQPADQVVVIGGDASFAVDALSSSPMRYQWLFNGIFSLPDQTNATLELPDVVVSNEGDYSVEVSNDEGAVVSSRARLRVIVAPSLVAEPADVEAAAGGIAELVAELAGSIPMDIQWFFSDSTPVPNGTNALLQLGPLSLSDSGGLYYLVASNLAGTVTSRVASVSVFAPPTIVVQPQPIRVILGATASFSVSAEGHAPLSFQWFGPDAQAIPGADGPELQLPAVSAASAGLYSVQVSNRVGVVTSARVSLEVVIPPSVELVSQEILAPVGGEAVITSVAAGSEPIFYQWVYFQTNVLADATNSTLVLSDLAETNSGIYQVIVTNLAGSAISGEMLLRVVPAPQIVVQPQPLLVAQGESAEFQVTATGHDPLSYQWLGPDSQPIPGATDRVLTLPGVTSAQAGSYSVWVSNAVGVVTSDAALLSVAVPPRFLSALTNQIVAVGSTVRFQAEIEGTEPIRFQWFYGESSLPVQPNSNVLVLEGVGLELSGTYFVEASNRAGVVRSEVSLLTVLLPPAITTPPQPATVNQGDSARFEVVAAGAEPLTYEWFGPDGVPLPGELLPVLNLASVQPSQGGLYTVRVQNIVGEVLSSGALLTVVVPPVVLTSPSDVLAPRGGEALLTVVAGGTEPLSYTWFYQLTNLISDATNTSLRLENLRLDQSGGYSVVVSNSAGVVQSSEAVLTVLEPPSITRQPFSFRVLQGNAARFEVIALGEPPLTYQWIGPDLSPVAGGSGAVLELAAVSATDAGPYRVEIRNAVGSIVSDEAILDVVSAPAIKSQPQPLLAARGGAAAMQVQAAGSEPLFYQWLLQATNLVANATNAVLSWEQVDFTNSGLYSVIVSNEFGVVTSQEAELQVLEAPSILGISPSVSVVVGQSAAFEAEVQGGEPLALQWYRENGQPVPGAQTSRLEFAAVSTSDAGYYFLRATNGVGTVDSAAVLLEVWVPPFETIRPLPQVVAVGSPAEFQVVAGGTLPISYQWLRDGTEPLVNETNHFLRFETTSLEMTGTYSVVLSNVAGVFVSDPVTLRVLERPVILRSPLSATVATGAVVRLDVEIAGSAPFSFQWYADGGIPIPGATEQVLILPAAQLSDSGRIFVEVANEVGVVSSAAATLVVLEPPYLLSEPIDQTVASGTTVELRAEIGGAPDRRLQWYLSATNPVPGAVTNPLVFPSVSVADSGIYHLTVTNEVGGTVSRSVTLTVLDPPLIDVVPKSLAVEQGKEAVFEVGAQGSDLRYQWFKDGTIPILGATNRVLVIARPSLADAANYSVVVSNLVGVAASTAASLRVLVPAQILSFSYDGNLAAISFFSHKNLRYTLENNDQLVGIPWRISSGSLLRKGTDGVITLYDVPGEAASYRFYRILVE
jgi:subtilisin-like proprotein convertase family protein